MARTTRSRATTETTTPTTNEPPKVLSPSEIQAQLDEAQLLLYRDRRRAHETLFDSGHRKTHSTPAFHWEMIDDFHNPLIRFLLQIGFRGSSKTTRGEEGVTIRGIFREFRYCLIGSSVSDIAQMRLHAIKRQFETNENILEIFGNLKTKVWGDEQIELSTGVVFRAVGRGQAIRGTKDTDIRPDFIWLDDIEDKKAVANETQLKKTLEWFDGELFGSADTPNLTMRVTANDMGPDCLANKLSRSSRWTTKRYPWIIGGKSIWEDRYPLAQSIQTKAEMYARGSGDEYEREFMCNSARPEAKTFRDEFLKVETRVRIYEPTNAMIVPLPLESGLSVSPCAGAVWSWVNDKCVVWECWSRNLKADQIIAETKRIDSQYRPVRLGITKSAYEDWAHASLPMPSMTPIKENDELDFIRALQPFFAGKQIIFAQEPSESWSQFIAFPNGPTEAPQALAYALHPTMRGGVTFYEDFSAQNIAPDLVLENGPTNILLNAEGTTVVGILCQVSGRGLRVFADWVETGDVIEVSRQIVQSANLTAQRRCNVFMPSSHFERGKDRITLSLRRIGIPSSAGGDSGEGRRELHRMLREQAKGLPRVLVASSARWTMNALSEGYTINAEDGPYKLIGESLESLCALASFGDLDDDIRTNAVSRDGRSYISARPVRTAHA